MTDLSLVECEEFEVAGSVSGRSSKYRATVLQFLGSGLVRARISCDFVGEAGSVCKNLKRWVGVDDPVRVFSRGRMVYLVREP